MRALLVAVVLAPLLAGCIEEDRGPQEVSFSDLLARATEARPDPRPDDRLVAASGVEGAVDLDRGNGLAPAWTYVFESVAGDRLVCTVLAADGRVLQERAYPRGNATEWVSLDGVIDSPAAVAAARKDADFGVAAVRAQRFVLTLSSDEERAFWIVSTASPSGTTKGLDVDALTGEILRPLRDLPKAAEKTGCP